MWIKHFFSFCVLNIVAIAGTTNLQTVRSSSFLCLLFPHIEGSKQVAALHEPSYVGGFTAFSLLAWLSLRVISYVSTLFFLAPSLNK